MGEIRCGDNELKVRRIKINNKNNKIMEKSKNELLFVAIALLTAALITLCSAFWLYLSHLTHENIAIITPTIFIILMEWLNYQLWIGKRKKDTPTPKKNIKGCIITGITLLAIVILTCHFVPNKYILIIDTILQCMCIYTILLLIAYLIYKKKYKTEDVRD